MENLTCKYGVWLKLYNVVASQRVPSIRSRKSKDVSLKSKMIVRVKFKSMLTVKVKFKNMLIIRV